MGKLISIESLPPLLQLYAKGEDVAVYKNDWTEQEWLQARWHRRALFRSIQRENPGSQYMWVDYQSLMSNEISTYTRRVLAKTCIKKWENLLQDVPVLRIIYLVELRRAIKKNPRPRRAKKRHLLKDARHKALHRGFVDPRTLGAIEIFVCGEVHYGIPAMNNYFE